MNKRKEEHYINNSEMSLLLFFIFFIIISIFLIISIFAPEKTISERENRTLQPFPKPTISTIFSGQFIKDFETHYSDTFPFRNFFLDVNDGIKKITSQLSFGKDDIVIYNTDKTGDDFGGEALEDVEKR